MDVVSVAKPTQAEILTLLPVSEMKQEKRISHNAEDALIADAIMAAFDYFDGREGWLRRAVLPQQWSFYKTAFADDFEVPFPPLQSVTSIAYRDDAGAWQTVAPSTYEVIPGTLFGRVVLAMGESWPAVSIRARAVRVNFVAGYPAADVPPGIRRAMKLLAGSLYEHREADFEDNRVSYVSRRIEYGVEKLAGRYRIRNDLYAVFDA